MTSLPRPPLRSSPPRPPDSLSECVPPTSKSSPARPSISSSPPRPYSWSTPSVPTMWSGPGPPISVTANATPAAATIMTATSAATRVAFLSIRLTPLFSGGGLIPSTLLYQPLHYYIKTKYYAILVQKSLTFLKKKRLDTCRPSEVPEGWQDSLREINCRV